MSVQVAVKRLRKYESQGKAQIVRLQNQENQTENFMEMHRKNRPHIFDIKKTIPFKSHEIIMVQFY